MNRLVKAELYRIRHSSNLMEWTIVICIILFIMPALTDIHFYEKTVSENLVILGELSAIYIMIFTAVLISVCIGISYQNKMAYYEVMEGHKISNIIFSKLIVHVSVMAAGWIVPYCIFLAVMAWKNGMGGSDKILLRIILLIIIHIHVCAASVLITTSVRNIRAAIVIFFRFFMLEGIVGVILELTGIKSKTADRVAEWFITSQYTKVLGGNIDSHIIISVIFSFVLECALWFTLSYIGMKKKKYR